jgi:hypothetical protein
MFTNWDMKLDAGIIALLFVAVASVITLTVILVIAIAEPKPYYPNQRTSLSPAQELGADLSQFARV